MGSIDEEWLQYVLHDELGEELAIYIGRELIAVVGIVFPTPKEPAYVLSNIAIKPDFYQAGIGSQLLPQVLRRYPLKPQEYWLAYVVPDNRAVVRFLREMAGALIIHLT